MPARRARKPRVRRRLHHLPDPVGRQGIHPPRDHDCALHWSQMLLPGHEAGSDHDLVHRHGLLRLRRLGCPRHLQVHGAKRHRPRRRQVVPSRQPRD